MTIKLLQEKGFEVSVIFSGAAHETTESIIKKMTEAKVIGRIDEEEKFDKEVVREYAELFRNEIEKI